MNLSCFADGRFQRNTSSLVAELLGRTQQQQHRMKGGPPRIAGNAAIPEQAERNAAWLSAFALKRWRCEQWRERVPRREGDEILAWAIT